MNEPWWIALIEALLVINLLLGLFAYLTLIERKVMGRMQLRYGPNRSCIRPMSLRSISVR